MRDGPLGVLGRRVEVGEHGHPRSQGFEDRGRRFPAGALAQLHGQGGPGEPLLPSPLVDGPGDLDPVEGAPDPGPVGDDLLQEGRTGADEGHPAAGQGSRVHEEVGTLGHRDDPERHHHGVVEGGGATRPR